ncbi:hypothetical protein ABFA07_019880 [Porites harrisoni]
MNENSS